MNRKFHLLFALAISLLCLSASIAAQDFRATITGRISDTNKAAVPNAQVQARNIGTNEVTSATTDSEGNYKLPFLRPGCIRSLLKSPASKKSRAKISNL